MIELSPRPGPATVGPGGGVKPYQMADNGQFSISTLSGCFVLLGKWWADDGAVGWVVRLRIAYGSVRFPSIHRTPCSAHPHLLGLGHRAAVGPAKLQTNKSSHDNPL